MIGVLFKYRKDGYNKEEWTIISAKGEVKRLSKRVGLILHVGRIHRLIKDGNHAKRVGSGAPIYMTAVLEYIAGEVLEVSGNEARVNKKHRITHRHFQLAVLNDKELIQLLGEVSISEGGVRLFIHSNLLSKTTTEE